MTTERVEPGVPKGSIGREPGIELDERARFDLVHAPLGLDADADQPRITQDTQMLGRPRLREPECLHELPDRPWPLEQQFERGPPVGIGQGRPGR